MKTANGKHLLAALLCVYSLNVRAAPASEDVIRVPTVTRLVKDFSELEFEIIAALKQKNQAKLTQLVDKNFEMQVALESADSVPLSEWLKTSMAEAHLYTYDITGMAVRDLGEAAIVSFDWIPATSAQQGSSPKFTIIDVWKKEGVDWKLAIRFASVLEKSEVRFPGFSLTDKGIEKKY